MKRLLWFFIDFSKTFNLEFHLLFIQLWKISHAGFFQIRLKNAKCYVSIYNKGEKKTVGGKTHVILHWNLYFLIISSRMIFY